MSADRTGQTWEYSGGVFVVTGPASSAVTFKGEGWDAWVDHPIVWLNDPFEISRAGKTDGFLEYLSAMWEDHDSFKRIA